MGSQRTAASLGPLAYVRLVSELALLLGLAFGGAWAGQSFGVSTALAIVLPALAGLVWGLFIAPRSRRHLADPARLCVEILLFAAAAILLAALGHWIFALVVVALYVAGFRHGRLDA